MKSPTRSPLRRGPLIAAVLGLSLTSPMLMAQELFEPPVPYSASRYQASWAPDKNPFALKSVPIPGPKKSFAEDLAIGSYYGSQDSPTLVVVNTKTHERFSLKKGVASSNGMMFESISLAPARKDIEAFISLGGEKASLKYDSSYVRLTANPGATPPEAMPGAKVVPGPANPAGFPKQPVVGAPPGAPAAPAAGRRPILVPGGNTAPGGVNPAIGGGNAPGPRVLNVPDRNSRRTNTAPIRTSFPGTTSGPAAP